MHSYAASSFCWTVSCFSGSTAALPSGGNTSPFLRNGAFRCRNMDSTAHSGLQTIATPTGHHWAVKVRTNKLAAFSLRT